MFDYITSDLHFFQNSMVRSGWPTRQFVSTEAMNDYLVELINSTVPADSTLCHVGDFSFAGRERTEALLERIRCKIIHVRGNHDERTNDYLQMHDMLRFKYRGLRVMVCHFPMLFWDQSYRGSVQFHGHIHRMDANIPGSCLNVGYDRHARILKLSDAFEMAAARGPGLEHHKWRIHSMVDNDGNILPMANENQ